MVRYFSTRPRIYTTLAFLALLGAPYIYDISSLRVKITQCRRNITDVYQITMQLAIAVHCMAQNLNKS